MLNKRGKLDNLLLIGGTIVLLVLFYYFIFGNPFSTPSTSESAFFQTGLLDQVQNSQTFSSLWNSNARFIDYILGGIPQILIDNTSPQAAPIVMLGIWLIFLLSFGDILSVFGFFSKPIAWVTAIVLTIIAANLKVISIISVALLMATAFLGALSVVVSIAGVFVLFLMFHFGTESLRRRIILRRAEDAAIRAVAGGEKAASGITVLREVADAAEKAGKKP